MEVSQESTGANGETSRESGYEEIKAEHAALDEKIRKLQESSHISGSQMVEIRNLKKQKLTLKDQMERIQLDR